MKLNVQMIGLDLDGTLLDSRKQLTQFTAEMLRQAAEKGINIVVATGRPLAGIPKELREFPGIRYAVTANGSRIVDMETGETLYEQLIEVETAKKILDLFGGYDTLREVYFDGVGHAKKEDLDRIDWYMEDPFMAEYIVRTRKRVANVEEHLVLENRGVDKVQALFRDTKDRDAAREILEAWKEVEVTGSLANNLEATAKGVDKGNSLLRLAERLAIPLERLLVFGDGENDKRMIQMAGVGVAMGNGLEEVKKVADYLTDSNDADGIGKFLQKYVL